MERAGRTEFLIRQCLSFEGFSFDAIRCGGLGRGIERARAGPRTYEIVTAGGAAKYLRAESQAQIAPEMGVKLLTRTNREVKREALRAFRKSAMR